MKLLLYAQRTSVLPARNTEKGVVNAIRARPLVSQHYFTGLHRNTLRLRVRLETLLCILSCIPPTSYNPCIVELQGTIWAQRQLSVGSPVVRFLSASHAILWQIMSQFKRCVVHSNYHINTLHLLTVFLSLYKEDPRPVVAAYSSYPSQSCPIECANHSVRNTYFDLLLSFILGSEQSECCTGSNAKLPAVLYCFFDIYYKPFSLV